LPGFCRRADLELVALANRRWLASIFREWVGVAVAEVVAVSVFVRQREFSGAVSAGSPVLGRRV
jgi:hypothetical protein